jgi:RHS repeat-associated protein
MTTTTNLTLSSSPPTQPAKKLHRTASLALRQRHLYGRTRRNNTGKELDNETGLYYYGARYMDPKISRWLSGDPAVGEYIPSAPVSEEAKKRNGSLPGMGGVFNYVNLHVYHYAGNNPVKYTDPDGRISEEEQAALMQEYIENAQRSSTFVPDPDSLSFINPIAIVANIRAMAIANLDQLYDYGNQCDDWLEKVLVQSGIDPLNYLAKPGASLSVQKHIDNAIAKGKTTPIPRRGVDITLPVGAYVVFMNERTVEDIRVENDEPHAGLLFVNRDGSVDFFQSSTSLPGMLSAKEFYKRGVMHFQEAYGYDKFYYQQIWQ